MEYSVGRLSKAGSPVWCDLDLPIIISSREILDSFCHRSASSAYPEVGLSIQQTSPLPSDLA